MNPLIILDISRLLSRASRSAPTGIDRVEMAYAKWLLGAQPESLTFVARTNWGSFGRISLKLATRFLSSLDDAWTGLNDGDAVSAIARQIRLTITATGSHLLETTKGSRSIYLLLSHQNLDRIDLIRRLKSENGLRFVCLIHDLIPIEFPEYARPGQTLRHRKRLHTVAELADGVIVNSESTRRAVEGYLRGLDARPAILAARLGVNMPPARVSPSPSASPYFVVLGTIEAKKNHLLLLNLWRSMAQRLGDGTPRLILIGHRGWKVQSVIDMLERAPAIGAFVSERSGLSDLAVEPLLQGAVALLLPSFAEGFGLPVAEALSRGVPVLCSDLPSLREVGLDAAEYLDPLDGPSWERAIRDYAPQGSARRAAQLQRILGYQAPTWEAHFEKVTAFLAGIAD